MLVSKFYGQATKGTRWMPWHFEAMKDVASCDGQATKGTRWMPWHFEAMKDVASCDKLR